jgi:hypothetical protein
MSASPIVRLLIAALSFGGGVAAGLMVASVANQEAQRRRVTGPAHARHFGDQDHSGVEEITGVPAPVEAQPGIVDSLLVEADLADHARRP